MSLQKDFTYKLSGTRSSGEKVSVSVCIPICRVEYLKTRGEWEWTKGMLYESVSKEFNRLLKQPLTASKRCNKRSAYVVP